MLFLFIDCYTLRHIWGVGQFRDHPLGHSDITTQGSFNTASKDDAPELSRKAETDQRQGDSKKTTE